MICEEYALNIRRKNGPFLYQIDCFATLEEALQEERSLELEEDEETDIVHILYDDLNREIDAQSIY